MKRRNVLLGLGTAAAGSAVAFSTGAFTNLSADRSVTVDVAADSAAALTMEVNEGTFTASKSSSAATANIGTADYADYANNGTAFPTGDVESLAQYSGDGNSLVSETNGKLSVNIGDYTDADGVNQGVVVFEDLIRVQNNSETPLSLGAAKAGDNNVNLDVLTVQITDDSVSPAQGEVVSLLNSNINLSTADTFGGITLLLNPDSTTTGETVDVTVTAEPQ